MGFFDFFKKKEEPKFEKIDFDKFNFDSEFDTKKNLGLNAHKIEPQPSFNEPSYNNTPPIPNQYNPSLNLNQQPIQPQIIQQSPINPEDLKLIKDSLENIKISLEALNQRTLKIEKEVTRRW